MKPVRVAFGAPSGVLALLFLAPCLEGRLHGLLRVAGVDGRASRARGLLLLHLFRQQSLLLWNEPSKRGEETTIQRKEVSVKKLYTSRMSSRFSRRTRADMELVLLTPGATNGPNTFYYMLRGGSAFGNITFLRPGDQAGEYVKTLGHYHPYDFDETYKVIQGEGVMLLQKRKEVDGVPQDDRIEEFRVVHLRAGDSIALPLRFGHVLVNVGSGFLITKDNSPSDPKTTRVRPHADYEPIKRMHGMAYYLVKQNGKPVLRKNPSYKEVGHTDLGGLPVIA